MVSRWLKLGGGIDHVSADHANVWDVRRIVPNGSPKSSLPCPTPVPMATRIGVVAQVFASWRPRSFLGPAAKFWFIESLGFWEIQGPGGTNSTNTDPGWLDNITGWIPRLGDVTRLLLDAAKRHTLSPAVPLLDHYQIDAGLGMAMAEHAMAVFGRAKGGGLN